MSDYSNYAQADALLAEARDSKDAVLAALAQAAATLAVADTGRDICQMLDTLAAEVELLRRTLGGLRADQARPPVPAARWLILPRHERKQIIAAYKSAVEQLAINAAAEEQAGVTEETENYHILNDEVWRLEQMLPWWRRPI